MSVQAPSELVDDLVRIRQWSQRAQGQDLPEVDTINAIVGDGAAVLVAGVAAAIRVDFRCRITGCFLQEFDGTSGSVAIKVEQAAAGAAPAWTTITPTTAPAISSGRYFEDPSCATWIQQDLARGDLLRFSVVSAATIMRILIGLRIRRLEP
jgi:hypothetical protein